MQLKLLILLLAMAAPAQATVFKFTLTATVGDISTETHIYSEDGGYTGYAETPPSIIHSGDPLSVTYTFDTSKAQRDDSYLPDKFALYYLIDSDLEVNIGAFHGLFQPTDTPDRLYIGNNEGYPGHYFDDVSLYGGAEVEPGTSPFAITDETIGFSFSFDMLDYSTTARTSVDIEEEPPLSSYPDPSLPWQTVYFSGSIPNGSIETALALVNPVATLSASAAVPEPASWALSLLAFGAVGVVMRRDRRTLAPFVA